MKKKRIAFVQPVMNYGGIEKVLLNLLKTFDYQKVDVDLYLMNGKGVLRSQVPSRVNVRVIQTDMSTRERISFFAQKREYIKMLWVCLLRALLVLVPWDSNVGTIIRMKMALAHSKNEYDKVIAFHYTDDSSRLFALNILKGKKKMIWVHGSVGLDKCQNLFDKFDEIIAVSQATEQKFLELYPQNKGKTKVLYNLLDIDGILENATIVPYDMNPVGVSIVSVGRLSEEKGFQLIPHIAHMLNEDGYQFDWYIIGDGPLREEISHTCDALSAHNVHLLGAKSNPYSYMKQCTLYVQPSFSEGYCTTTNEAKLLCKPIIATDVSGMREQFEHEKNAFIVPSATVEAIYHGVKYLLDNEDVRIKYVESLRKDGMKQQEKINAIHRELGLIN